VNSSKGLRTRFGFYRPCGHQAIHRTSATTGCVLDFKWMPDRAHESGYNPTSRTLTTTSSSPIALIADVWAQDLLDWKDLQVVKSKPSTKPERERVRQASLKIASISEACEVSRT
jgi:hypothetical protein